MLVSMFGVSESVGREGDLLGIEGEGEVAIESTIFEGLLGVWQRPITANQRHFACGVEMGLW